MRITTKYGKIERVIYEWDEGDVQRALMASQHIPSYEPGRRYEFEISGGDINQDDTYGPPYARLTVIYETDVEGSE